MPVQDYETLRPYVEDQRLTGAPALTAESPLFYAQTSGTTGKPKYIPITPSVLAMHRAEQALFSYLQYSRLPRAFAGKALGIMGAAVEGHLDSGHAGRLGLRATCISRCRGSCSRDSSFRPRCRSIPDYNLEYLVILRLALAEPRRHLPRFAQPDHVPPPARRAEQPARAPAGLARAARSRISTPRPAAPCRLARQLRPIPHRAARLRRSAALTFANVWPDIRLVTTWTGGSCGIALDRLRAKLPPRHAGHGAWAISPPNAAARSRSTAKRRVACRRCTIIFSSSSSRSAGTAAGPEFLTLDQLEAGRRYYVLVTTAAGLYRYFMNDLVEVTGFFHQTPLLRFVQKGKGVTSLTGEKLYEAQMIEAVQRRGRACGLTLSFFLLVADEERPPTAVRGGGRRRISLDARPSPRPSTSGWAS